MITIMTMKKKKDFKSCRAVTLLASRNSSKYVKNVNAMLVGERKS